MFLDNTVLFDKLHETGQLIRSDVGSVVIFVELST